MKIGAAAAVTTRGARHAPAQKKALPIGRLGAYDLAHVPPSSPRPASPLLLTADAQRSMGARVCACDTPVLARGRADSLSGLGPYLRAAALMPFPAASATAPTPPPTRDRGEDGSPTRHCAPFSLHRPAGALTPSFLSAAGPRELGFYDEGAGSGIGEGRG
ncbi:hypothetical protein B0H17DRAFT_1208825 [Mycena rosella]|uniref:Uncharacterized protein n=1 Tax=Mycena rosella TaxID=1033263 RepID=A0AAD7CZY7_MYCRO|nr:hypothetical protein B0H17DRAFT_1208825 [Mycena rosella]